MTESQRDALINLHIQKIKKDQQDGRFNEVDIKAFYYGNQYILMKYDVYYDVRLVGAPPSNIGKFGGDTDNWMWPRHTGDFSVFRIYANKENKPSDYAADNIPYTPKEHLKISLKGVQEGDFTMIFGYPGSTEEYIPATEIQFITEQVNPLKINLRRQKLDIMAKAMETDPTIRIQYSAKYAGVANGWKKWIGENKGIKKLNSVYEHQKMESEFVKWAQKEGNNKAGLLDQFNQLYAQWIPYELAYTYFIESVYYHDLTRFANSFARLVYESQNEALSDEKFNQLRADFTRSAETFYKDYNQQVDKDLLIASLDAYYTFNNQAIEKSPFQNSVARKYKGSVKNYVNAIYKSSVFANGEKMLSFLATANRKSISKLQKDLMYVHATSCFNFFINNIRPQSLNYQVTKDSLQRIYMAALMEFKKDERMYPDANSSLRIAYGKVEPYSPQDAVEYSYFTTLAGIMEKENPEIYDYVVEPKLKTLYQQKDYGAYADRDGSMHVCFIASNHTTGGNSGSPALDANGYLIGINFDRNWEGTMSDLDYNPDQCRNIMLDIRYCLFVIDKFAGAGHLVDEMTIVQ
jgi:hypothetical protein